MPTIQQLVRFERVGGSRPHLNPALKDEEFVLEYIQQLRKNLIQRYVK